MVDAERVIRLLDGIRQDVERLRRISPGGAEALDATKYRFITAIEGAARVAHHLAVSEGWTTPESNADAFAVLGRQGSMAEPRRRHRLTSTSSRISGRRASPRRGGSKSGWPGATTPGSSAPDHPRSATARDREDSSPDRGCGLLGSGPRARSLAALTASVGRFRLGRRRKRPTKTVPEDLSPSVGLAVANGGEHPLGDLVHVAEAVDLDHDFAIPVEVDQGLGLLPVDGEPVADRLFGVVGPSP